MAQTAELLSAVNSNTGPRTGTECRVIYRSEMNSPGPGWRPLKGYHGNGDEHLGSIKFGKSFE